MKKKLLISSSLLLLILMLHVLGIKNIGIVEVFAQDTSNEVVPTTVKCNFCGCNIKENGDCCCSFVNVCACSICFKTIECGTTCCQSYSYYSFSDLGGGTIGYYTGSTYEITPTSGNQYTPVYSYEMNYAEFWNEYMSLVDWILAGNNLADWVSPYYVPEPTPIVIPEPTAADYVTTTLNYTGNFTRGTVRPITLSTTVFDCSGWVYFVILNNDQNLAFALAQNGTSTGGFQTYIASHGGYHSIPQVGDLAMWGAHVEFVTNYDGTFVTLSGSRGNDGLPVPTTIGNNWLTLSRMGDISSNFIGFWTIQ